MCNDTRVYLVIQYTWLYDDDHGKKVANYVNPIVILYNNHYQYSKHVCI